MLVLNNTQNGNYNSQGRQKWWWWWRRTLWWREETIPEQITFSIHAKEIGGRDQRAIKVGKVPVSRHTSEGGATSAISSSDLGEIHRDFYGMNFLFLRSVIL